MSEDSQKELEEVPTNKVYLNMNKMEMNKSRFNDNMLKSHITNKSRYTSISKRIQNENH